jgi:hypothetical protein
MPAMAALLDPSGKYKGRTRIRHYRVTAVQYCTLGRYIAPRKPNFRKGCLIQQSRKNPNMCPKISQETLAEKIGMTRSQVNFFRKKFEKLGFIHHDGGLHVNDSPLNVLLHA